MEKEVVVQFATRCRSFFGFRAGTGFKDFVEEIKELTPEDKQELCKNFNDTGMPTVLANTPKAK